MLADAVAALAGKTRARLAALEKRVSDLEARSMLRYEGTWAEGRTYGAGCCVTFRGSIWCAGAETREKPGDGQTAWRLCVKRGADGRDLRGVR